MTLPKQNYPIFTLTVPSTQKKIQFRSFNVREENTLLQASESEDIDVITNAITEVLSACIKQPFDVGELTPFDLEYVMTQVRAKSVGEIVEFTMECDVDPNHEKSNVKVDLLEMKVTFDPAHSKTVHLFDDVGIILDYPKLKDLKKFNNMTGIHAMVMCIDKIYNKDEVFDAKEQTFDELKEFLLDLKKEQLAKIEATFFRTMPEFTHSIEYVCPTCGTKHTKKLKGLSNFFI